MANVGTAITGALGTALVATGQINQIATAALGLFAIYKQVRDDWKAANPDQPDPFLTDEDLIRAFEGSAQKLVALADRLLAKYGGPTT